MRFPFPLEFDLWLSELVCVAINISYNLSILKWCASLVYTSKYSTAFLQSKVLIAPLLCTWDRQFFFNNLCLSYVLSWSYFPVHPWVSRPADRDEPPSTPMNPWMSKVRFASWSCLVGGWPTTLKNMKGGWDDEIPNIWKNGPNHQPVVLLTSLSWTCWNCIVMCFSWISFKFQLSVYYDAPYQTYWIPRFGRWFGLKMRFIFSPNPLAYQHFPSLTLEFEGDQTWFDGNSPNL